MYLWLVHFQLLAMLFGYVFGPVVGLSAFPHLVLLLHGAHPHPISSC
jgi:hypothetical protein